MLPRIRDVRGELGKEVQPVEDLEVPADAAEELGAGRDAAAAWEPPTLGLVSLGCAGRWGRGAGNVGLVRRVAGGLGPQAAALTQPAASLRTWWCTFRWTA